MKRTVFFVSESTGITSETWGNSLLSQFSGMVQFNRIYMPFVNTAELANQLVQRILEVHQKDGVRPIVFATMINREISDIIKKSDCLYLELFESFVEPLAAELGSRPALQSGLSHGISRTEDYTKRIEAINFTMSNDDGMRPDNFINADIVLIGVSRSGKTPTSLYLAMHFGVRTANYPITEEDFNVGTLPKVIYDCRDKLFGLTIEAERLHAIREERRPGSAYASLERCQQDVKHAQQMFRSLDIPVINTTKMSIEEISATILKMISSRKALA